GHNHFFKNNYVFQQWTDADGILDYLEFARGYITTCEERYGEVAVERLLDAAHARPARARGAGVQRPVAHRAWQGRQEEGQDRRGTPPRAAATAAGEHPAL